MGAESDASPWDDSPGFLLWHATLRWQRGITRVLKPLGLTHVQFVLLTGTRWLSRQGEAPSQRELSDHAGTDVMMTSQVVRALVGKGLIRREGDPSDCRIKRLYVTEEGGEVARRALAEVAAADRAYFRAARHPEILIPQLLSLADPDR